MLTDQQWQAFLHWFNGYYLEALADTSLVGEARIRENLHILYPLYQAWQRCQQCQEGNGCNGQKMELDVSASRFYGEYLPKITPCPNFPRPLVDVFTGLQGTGFSTPMLNKVVQKLTKMSSDSDLTKMEQKNGLTKTERFSEITNGLTKTEGRGRNCKNDEIRGEKSDQGWENTPISLILSRLETEGVGRELLVNGGLVVLPLSIYGGKGVQNGAEGRIERIISLGSRESITTTRARAHARAYEIPIFGDGVIQASGVSAHELGHWLGVFLALHGVAAGFLDALGMHAAGDWGDSPLAQFLQYSEEVGALVVTNYDHLPPGRQSTSLVLAALSRFLSEDGILWVVISQPPEQMQVRDPLETPVWSEILELPRYEVVNP